MHRVELKEPLCLALMPTEWWSLMHRVELKVLYCCSSKNGFVAVPNAPCGVERPPGGVGGRRLLLVPNAPCGVESLEKFRWWL